MNAVLDATGGQGVDVVLDMMGGSFTQHNLDVVKVGGRIAVIGSLESAYSTISVRSLMRKRITLSGSTLRAQTSKVKACIAQQLFTHVWPLFQEGKLKIVVHSSFALVEAAAAHKVMEDRTHIGKLVLVP